MFNQLNKPKDIDKNNNEFTINLDNAIPNRTNIVLGIIIRFFFVLVTFLTITSFTAAFGYIIPKSILLAMLEEHINRDGILLINFISMMISMTLGLFSGMSLGWIALEDNRVKQYVLKGDINV